MLALQRQGKRTGVISFRINQEEQEELLNFAAFYGLKPNQLAKQALIERLEDLEDLSAVEKVRKSGLRTYSLEEIAKEFEVSL
ncbi:hypothetical protein FACS1894125_0760 [Actinomycetota bacterium]|nr:hypothetical protein FACS1894125_0760 [Actinomycetota bacterium]